MRASNSNKISVGKVLIHKEYLNIASWIFGLYFMKKFT
jgi:hypothetical protein